MNPTGANSETLTPLLYALEGAHLGFGFEHWGLQGLGGTDREGVLDVLRNMVTEWFLF